MTIGSHGRPREAESEPILDEEVGPKSDLPDQSAAVAGLSSLYLILNNCVSILIASCMSPQFNLPPRKRPRSSKRVSCLDEGIRTRLGSRGVRSMLRDNLSDNVVLWAL